VSPAIVKDPANQNSEDIMHGSTCECLNCQAARQSAFESESFGYEVGEFASPLTEAEEVELAMELMAVSSEAEMDQFLGKMFGGVWKRIKKVGSVVGKIAKPLGGVLKAIAKKALPFVGGALGSFIPIPGVGTAIGSALGSALSKALELEYGELEQEEAELEMARRFVRIAATAAQQAASAPPAADAMTAVNQALVFAARRHLPSTDLSALDRVAPGVGGASHSGRWIRQGGNIVVVGA
jgi:uncharacterized protein (DUF697 family)